MLHFLIFALELREDEAPNFLVAAAQAFKQGLLNLLAQLVDLLCLAEIGVIHEIFETNEHAVVEERVSELHVVWTVVRVVCVV